MSRTRLRVEPLEDRLAPAAGQLDPTFGTGGIAALPMPNSASVVATAPDNKVVVGWTATLLAAGGPVNNTDFTVTRLTADGQIDTSFNGTGIVQIAFDLAGSFTSATSYNTLSDVAIDAEGRVVVVGTASEGPGATTVMAVARLTSDGHLDPSFGTGGKVTISFAAGNFAGASAVAINAASEVLIAGYDQMGRTGTGLNPPTNFAAAKLTSAGRLDPTFGSGGVVSVPFPVGTNSVASADAVAWRGDAVVLVGQVAVDTYIASVGKIIVNVYDTAVMELTSSGNLSPSFGDGGRMRLGDPADAHAPAPTDVAFLADGRATVIGAGGAFRLTAAGRLDPSYGTNGRVTSPGQGVVLADGRTVFTQPVYSTNYPTDLGGSRVVGLSTDGLPDPAYAGDLISAVYFPGTAAVQSDGNLVLVANVATPGTGVVTFGVARLVTAFPPVAGFVPSATGAVTAGGAADGTLQVLNPTNGTYALTGTTTAYAGFQGNVRSATADVNGDGTADYIIGAGPGGAPEIKIVDGKTGVTLADFLAFEASFTGGVFVAAADLTGDGKAEVVVTPDQGGGPRVVVFTVSPGGSASQRASFFGIDDANFRGGARIAVGDINKDGSPDLVVAAGFLGGPRAAVFDGKTVFGTPTRLVNDFFAFPGTDAVNLRNGAFVAAGDVSGDGYSDLIFAGGPGGAPRVFILSGALVAGGDVAGAQASPVANFFVGGNASDRGGVTVAVVAGATRSGVAVGSGQGNTARVRVYMGTDFTSAAEPTAFQDIPVFGGATLTGGVFVG